MRLLSAARFPQFHSTVARLAAASCGWALLVLVLVLAVGCGGGSSLPTDAGADAGGHAGTRGTGVGGTTSTGTGGHLGSGGSGSGGVTGVGGSSATGGAPAVVVDGAADSGPDTGISDGGDICGDAAGLSDTDSDGTPDCRDGCPMDFNKTAPGVCGCGLLDFDSDGDGVLDCNDRCPGAPDVDTDNDGVLDCLDACPKDSTRTTAGVCGCGVPATTPLCLVHRYSFNDTAATPTSTIADSITIAGISPANGTAPGTASLANGLITLAGGASNQVGGQFVTLPAGAISSLGNNATFEAWVIWTPGAATSGPWQRVFDFGNSDQPAGTPGTGATYLFLSPLNGATSLVRAAITLASNGGEDFTDGTGSLPTNSAQPLHVAVVVNGDGKLMTLYVNGLPNGTPVPLKDSSKISSLKDDNNWLGRSQWAGDQLFAGSIAEFRIYGAALTADQIAASAAAGPDLLPTFPDAGTSDSGANPDAGADAPSGQ